MILTVTLNPMLDKTVDVGSFQRGKIQRASRVGMVVGGKGVNVARQLHRLGVPATATGCWGGWVGHVLDGLLEAEGIRHEFVWIASTTREGVTYREPDGTWSAVFEPPHEVTSREAESLLAVNEALFPRARWVVCCGSSPCPATDDVYARITTAARKRGIRVVLDSYGKAFRLAIDALPEMVKVNAEEVGQTFGGRPATDGEFRSALRRFTGMGIRYAIITDGSRPCYATDGSSWWKAEPPAVCAVNPTGSGDSMIAGILASLEQGRDFPGALARGCAAGAANAEVWEVSDASAARIEELVPAVRMEQFGALDT